jgi:hypothetical protein
MAITAVRREDNLQDLYHFVRRSSMPHLRTFDREELQKLKASHPAEFCKALTVPFLVQGAKEEPSFELSTVLQVAELDASTPVEAHGEY